MKTLKEDEISFDIESTSLFKKNTSPREYWKYPYIVQIAWAFGETNKSYIIKPDNYLIGPESTKIHGITTEYALLKGAPIIDVLHEFKKDLKGVKKIICHNIDFDIPVLLANCYRHQFSIDVLQKEAFCTMKYMTNICKLPGKYGYKYPKLIELYEFLFHKKPECRMHDALNDVIITIECYREICKRYIDI